MERKMRYLIAGLLILIAQFAFSQDLVILHTNDVHSNIEPLSSGRNAVLAVSREGQTT